MKIGDKTQTTILATTLIAGLGLSGLAIKGGIKIPVQELRSMAGLLNHKAVLIKGAAGLTLTTLAGIGAALKLKGKEIEDPKIEDFTEIQDDKKPKEPKSPKEPKKPVEPKVRKQEGIVVTLPTKTTANTVDHWIVEEDSPLGNQDTSVITLEE
ncbi:MAG: hypothetical protein AB7F31_00405 [Parachlamydiales bacterium]